MTNSVIIIGAGTMGAGIAQVAATAGWTVHLRDVDDEIADRALEGVRARLERLVEKGRLTADDGAAAAQRLHAGVREDDLGRAELVIEAVVENLSIKAAVLGALLPHLRPDAIIATNTSSLSVTDIGARIGAGPRTCGMHFFNPAPLLKLVEIIAGAQTDAAVADRAAAIAESWGKVVARAADVPGFIVNHVARPYYLEAFRILEDGYAGPEEIDEAMRRLGGFRMGPLELTDLIGQDVNTATTRSVWERLGRPALLAPSALQERLVADGHLGRKKGRGVYRYIDGTAGAPAIDVARHAIPDDAALHAAVDDFAAAATNETGSFTERYVLARILASLMVQAREAVGRGVATEEDIDLALRFGTNYPRGPFDWRRAVGDGRLNAFLTTSGAQRIGQ